MTILEAISKCNKVLHNGEELDMEALAVIVDYADSCYVEHCENVGEVAIENIEELQKETINEIIDWIEWYAYRHKSKDSLTPMINALKEYFCIFERKK